jgi:hypothetical protein
VVFRRPQASTIVEIACVYERVGVSEGCAVLPCDSSCASHFVGAPSLDQRRLSATVWVDDRQPATMKELKRAVTEEALIGIGVHALSHPAEQVGDMQSAVAPCVSRRDVMAG